MGRLLRVLKENYEAACYASLPKIVKFGGEYVDLPSWRKDKYGYQAYAPGLINPEKLATLSPDEIRDMEEHQKPNNVDMMSIKSNGDVYFRLYIPK